jgi:hypothetical protein
MKKHRTNQPKADQPKKAPVIFKLKGEDLERVAGGLAFQRGACPPSTDLY